MVIRALEGRISVDVEVTTPKSLISFLVTGSRRIASDQRRKDTMAKKKKKDPDKDDENTTEE